MTKSIEKKKAQLWNYNISLYSEEDIPKPLEKVIKKNVDALICLLASTNVGINIVPVVELED